MKCKYKNVADLVFAFRKGELDEDDFVWLDNDEVFLYKDDVCVYRSHPDTMLEQALDFLGIPAEHV